MSTDYRITMIAIRQLAKRFIEPEAPPTDTEADQIAREVAAEFGLPDDEAAVMRTYARHFAEARRS